MLARHENILVVSLRRSGGKLVRWLLDGHPDIRALPFEHWHSDKKGKFPGSILDRFHQLSAEEKLEVTGFPRVTIPKIVKARGPEVATALMKQLMVDADRAESSPELYEAFVHRYFKTVHAIDSGVRTVNHCGNLALMTADQIDRVFGPSIKIVIWRDPRAAYVSAKSELIRRGQSPTEADLRSFCREYRTRLQELFALAEHLLALRGTRRRPRYVHAIFSRVA